jgi:hypothetical protein
MKTRTTKPLILLILVIFGLTACGGLTETISATLPVSAVNPEEDVTPLLVRVDDTQSGSTQEVISRTTTRF